MILYDQAGAGECITRVVAPDPALQGFVEHLWVRHDPKSQGGIKPWRIVPDLSPHIVCVVSGERGFNERIRCALVGPRSRFADTSLANRIRTVGVRLKSGTLPLLTRLPAWEFADRSVRVEDVFGPKGQRLVEALTGGCSAGEALQALIEFLRREFSTHKPPRGAWLIQKARAEDLGASLGLPNRTLHARMKEQVGLAPKRLLRIQRLHWALAVRRHRSAPWAQVSAICGFADQAHLVREFQDLLGEAPGAWEKRRLSADLFKTVRGLPH